MKNILLAVEHGLNSFKMLEYKKGQMSSSTWWLSANTKTGKILAFERRIHPAARSRQYGFLQEH